MTGDRIRGHLNFLASTGQYANTTMEKDDLRELLLQTGGTLMARGYLYNIVSKPIGAGVYRVTLEVANLI